MTSLQIILTVLGAIFVLLIAIILFGKAGVHISSHGDLLIALKILGIRKKLIHEKKEEESTLTDYQLLSEKERKKQLRLQRKAEKKQLKQDKKKAKKKPMPKLGNNWLDTIKFITSLLKILGEKTKGKVNIKIEQLRLTVASSNAAKTAILYGIATQSVSYLLTFVNAHFANVWQCDEGVNVTSDFTKETPSADVEMDCVLPIYNILSVALALWKAYRKKQKELFAQSNQSLSNHENK